MLEPQSGIYLPSQYHEIPNQEKTEVIVESHEPKPRMSQVMWKYFKFRHPRQFPQSLIIAPIP